MIPPNRIGGFFFFGFIILYGGLDKKGVFLELFTQYPPPINNERSLRRFLLTSTMKNPIKNNIHMKRKKAGLLLFDSASNYKFF